MKDIIIKLFVALTLVFAWLINARTPMMWEDVIYTLKANSALGAAMSNAAVADTIQLGRYERVKNLEELAESTYYHYMNANGRMFPHLTSQIFGPLIGKKNFDIINALMLILLISIITFLVIGNKKNYWRWWVIVLSACWFLMPETNTGFFLMTYALNYLWSSTICSLFLCCYLSLRKQRIAPWITPFCYIFAFGAGWSHEGLVVGMAAGLILDNLFDLRLHQLNTQKLTWAMFFCLGATFLCLSPGNFTRIDDALPLYNHLLSFTRLKIFWLFLLCWCVFSRSYDFVRENRLLLVILFFQALFLFYVGYRNGRVLWGTEFFSLILLLKIFHKREQSGKNVKHFSYFMLFMLSSHFIWLSYRSERVHRQYNEVIALYNKSSDGIVYFDLLSESDMVRDFIPTPLCYYKSFELHCISLFYSHDKKSLRIYPTKMSSNQNGMYQSPNAWYIVFPNDNQIEISYEKKVSLNPKYSSLIHVLNALVHNVNTENVTKMVIGNPFHQQFVIELPQDYEGQISNIIVKTKSRE